MNLPNITQKQQEIVKLLYRYRYLNRIQIQTLMRHKDRKTINLWLRDLRSKHYVGWEYSTHFAEKTKPAVYHLAINGVRYIRQQTVVDADGDECYAYGPEEVRKRYRDKDGSMSFRNRSMLLADCCIDMLKKTSETVRYSCYTQTELAEPDNEFHFLLEGDLASQLGPQLCITKQEKLKTKTKTTHYLLEVFDENLPRYRMSKRLKQYVKFVTEGDWEAERDEALPTILFVCYRLTDLIYAKRRTRKLIADERLDEKPKMWFTTVEKLKQEGYSGKIWEEA